MNARCKCERVELQRLDGGTDMVTGVYSAECPVHFVRERDTWLGKRSASLPVGKHARQITDYVWHSLRVGAEDLGWMTQTSRRETSAEVQRRLYSEAI